MELELECTHYPAHVSSTSAFAGGVPSDAQRFYLAYQGLAVVSGIAGADAKLPDVLTAMASGQAQNASGE